MTDYRARAEATAEYEAWVSKLDAARAYDEELAAYDQMSRDVKEVYGNGETLTVEWSFSFNLLPPDILA